jgi:hypothetical protein
MRFSSTQRRSECSAQYDAHRAIVEGRGVTKPSTAFFDRHWHAIYQRPSHRLRQLEPPHLKPPRQPAPPAANLTMSTRTTAPTTALTIRAASPTSSLVCGNSQSPIRAPTMPIAISLRSPNPVPRTRYPNHPVVIPTPMIMTRLSFVKFTVIPSREALSIWDAGVCSVVLNRACQVSRHLITSGGQALAIASPKVEPRSYRSGPVHARPSRSRTDAATSFAKPSVDRRAAVSFKAEDP